MGLGKQQIGFRDLKLDFVTPVLAIIQWPVNTQVGARRNALIASTALTDRIRERRDVEDFLSALEVAPGPAQEASGHA